MQLPKNYLPKKTIKTNAEWEKILTPDVFAVARKGELEKSSRYNLENHSKTGIYCCKICENPIFNASAMFETKCMRICFFNPIHKNCVLYKVDSGNSLQRVEVICSGCNSHLGEIYDDSPEPFKLKYSINGIVLKYLEK